MKAAGEHPQHRHRQQRQPRLGHADVVNALGDLLRRVGIHIEIVRPSSFIPGHSR